jgi:hypothetical protein
MASLDGKNLKQVIDPTVAKAFAHPLRGHAWVAVCEKGIASPGEIAEELGLDVKDVSYHFRELKRRRLVRLARTVQRRGFEEHFYEPCPPALYFDDVAWMGIPADIRARFSAGLLRQIIEQLIDALNSGSFDARNRHLSQSWLLVDEAGWQEAIGAVDALLARLHAIQERCATRRDESEPGIPVAVTMAAFQSAPGVARDRTGKTDRL